MPSIFPVILATLILSLILSGNAYAESSSRIGFGLGAATVVVEENKNYHAHGEIWYQWLVNEQSSFVFSAGEREVIYSTRYSKSSLDQFEWMRADVGIRSVGKHFGIKHLIELPLRFHFLHGLKASFGKVETAVGEVARALPFGSSPTLQPPW